MSAILISHKYSLHSIFAAHPTEREINPGPAILNATAGSTSTLYYIYNLTISILIQQSFILLTLLSIQSFISNHIDNQYSHTRFIFHLYNKYYILYFLI